MDEVAVIVIVVVVVIVVTAEVRPSVVIGHVILRICPSRKSCTSKRPVGQPRCRDLCVVIGNVVARTISGSAVPILLNKGWFVVKVGIRVGGVEMMKRIEGGICCVGDGKAEVKGRGMVCVLGSRGDEGGSSGGRGGPSWGTGRLCGRAESDGRGQECERPGMRTVVVEADADEFPFKLGNRLVVVLCVVQVESGLEHAGVRLGRQVEWWVEVVVEIVRVRERDGFLLKRWLWIEREHRWIPSVVDGPRIAVEIGRLGGRGGQS